MKKIHLLTAATMAIATLAAASSASAATVLFDFSASPHQNNVGPTETYTVSGVSLIASGFTYFWNSPTDLYGKHDGGTENGLGLAIGEDHEIGYHEGWVQLNVQDLFTKLTNVQFGTNSTTNGETWTVYGTNTAGTLSGATQVITGNTEGLHSLGALGAYKYYDFVSTSHNGGGDFLITSLQGVTAVPELGTWGMMLLGMGMVGAGLRLRRPVAVKA